MGIILAGTMRNGGQREIEGESIYTHITCIYMYLVPLTLQL